MFRKYFSLVLAFLVIGLSAVAPVTATARESSQINILLVLDATFYRADQGTCLFDIEGQTKFFMTFYSLDGKHQGSLGLVRGEIAELGYDDGTSSSVCAFARQATINTMEDVEIRLHGVPLTTISPSGIDSNEYLFLDVDREGLISTDILDTRDVEALGIELPETGATTSARSTRSSRSSTSSRTTSEGNSSETRSSNTSQNRSSRNPSPSGTTSTESTTGIITGEWDMEGESTWDIFYVSIEEDPYGQTEEFIATLDPIELAVEIGMPLVGEGRAPEGCRLFAFSGPLGMPLYTGTCSDGEYYLYSASTDKALLDEAMKDFSNGRPFKVPRGYWVN